jgi:hypothetical protein
MPLLWRRGHTLKEVSELQQQLTDAMRSAEQQHAAVQEALWNEPVTEPQLVYVCVGKHGVGYRASPNMDDRIPSRLASGLRVANRSIKQYGVASAVSTQTDSAGNTWIKLEGGGGGGGEATVLLVLICGCPPQKTAPPSSSK